ncbi:MAG TPA: ATP-binding protein [Caldimonas sp.]|nr:ATP-binding protein [Caldimonas sp.]
MACTDRLIRTVDWFIPAELQKTTATLWRARIFVISHVLGPLSAVAILGYLYRVQAPHDWVYWTLCVLCGSFWTLPFALKLTGDLSRPALFSFCVLTLISVFGSFFYGGVSSPFLPWFLTAQLLGFFYLSDRPRLVLAIIGANLAAFSAAYLVNGAFPERVPIGDLSHVGMISVCAATIYNSMMAIYYAYVMVAQSALQQEIKKHLETAAKLRIAKHDAERANEAKAVFLAKMSHQLRTPLNAIIGYSEILLEDAEASEETVDAKELRSINNAGRHLLSLVSDVLHMPKIDSEDVDVRLSPVNLDHCLEEVSATCRNLISHNGNVFAFEKHDELGTIQTDDTRLRQILINLLSNAGKFTRNGRVVLRARRLKEGSREQVLISVQDTGIGIPPDAIPSLFKNFNQLHSNVYGGTGLGLALSQKLAQLLNGEISVESRVSRGSEFTLRLPVLERVVAAAA